jgi:hypothetical protein
MNAAPSAGSAAPQASHSERISSAIGPSFLLSIDQRLAPG